MLFRALTIAPDRTLAQRNESALREFLQDTGLPYCPHMDHASNANAARRMIETQKIKGLEYDAVFVLYSAPQDKQIIAAHPKKTIIISEQSIVDTIQELSDVIDNTGERNVLIISKDHLGPGNESLHKFLDYTFKLKLYEP